MRKPSVAETAVLGLAALASLQPSEAFVDDSFPLEFFSYRERNWTVPMQPRTWGYFGALRELASWTVAHLISGRFRDR